MNIKTLPVINCPARASKIKGSEQVERKDKIFAHKKLTPTLRGNVLTHSPPL